MKSITLLNMFGLFVLSQGHENLRTKGLDRAVGKRLENDLSFNKPVVLLLTAITIRQAGTCLHV